MDRRISISIIIPVYNEYRNLQNNVLEKILNYLNNIEIDWELIISNDGSTDGSDVFLDNFVKKINDKRFLLIHNIHGGKAFALKYGIEKANKEWTLYMDLDQSTKINELDKLVKHINSYKVIIGSRGNKRTGTNTFRKFASYIFNNLRKVSLLNSIDDTQCGFKLFKTELLKDIFPKLTVLKSKKRSNWVVSAFDVELLYMFEILDIKIKEVNVKWQNTDLSNTKNKNSKFILESLDMLLQLIDIKFKTYIGYYKNLLKQN